MEIIAIIVAVFIGWLAYGMITAPIMPDDYGMTDKEIEREKIEKQRIREDFKLWKVKALEEVARLKLKKKIESIDRAGLAEILNG